MKSGGRGPGFFQCSTKHPTYIYLFITASDETKRQHERAITWNGTTSLRRLTGPDPRHYAKTNSSLLLVLLLPIPIDAQAQHEATAAHAPVCPAALPPT